MSFGKAGGNGDESRTVAICVPGMVSVPLLNEPTCSMFS